ncbi:hypothetical protein LXL04_016435 [Taraxacum kok-saghyz]
MPQRRWRMNGGAVRKAWVVAASIGAVEALKDQGVARWNGPLTELHHHFKTKLVDRSSRSLCTSTKFSYCSSAVGTTGKFRVKRAKGESIKKVMDMSCFGPNTVRF